MSSYVQWSDIRDEHVARAGGEEAVAAGKEELLAAVAAQRLIDQKIAAEELATRSDSELEG